MATPQPDPPTTEARRGRRRFRPRGRGALIGASVLALLLVAGVVAALLPGGPGHGGDRFGPGSEVGLLGDAGEFDELAVAGHRGGPGRHGPGGFDRGRPGGFDRGLGDDALLAGTVVSTADGSLVLTPDGAPQRSLRIDDDARVRGGDNRALGDLAPGERVVVRVEGTGDAATAVSVLAPRARVVGTVTALTDGRATVAGVNGLTSTVDVTGLGRQPAVGDLVVLTGVAADATTVRADGIRVLPKVS